MNVWAAARRLFGVYREPYRFPEHIERVRLDPVLMAIHFDTNAEHRINPAVNPRAKT